MINYRIAGINDAPELKRLNDLFNGEDCNTLDDIEESLKHNEHELVCVAANGSNLVGFCCGQIFKSMCYPIYCAEITELFVMDDFRRQGIGKSLLQFTEDILINRGVKHFHVLTGDKNTAAQALYRSRGYADTNEILLDKFTIFHSQAFRTGCLPEH